jgi:acyl-coenzyme A synthetase/AMP-(fatty) acid ligase
VKETIKRSRLRIVTFGGERITASLVPVIDDLRVNEIRFFNTYGQSEMGDVTLQHEIRAHEPGTSVPIGRPFGNTDAYVLDRYRRRLPDGIIGELYLAGDGIAAGYFRKRSSTRAVFLPHPFRPGKTVFKTGDLVRSETGALLTYHGRNDFQVRIRGHRVELGEIEAALLRFPGIAQTVVTTADHGRPEPDLAAYYSGPDRIDERALRDHVRSLLPIYMVPATFTFLSDLPLNKNGKIDRSALPVPDRGRNRTTASSAKAPKTVAEIRLARLWRRVLKVDAVGRSDNFFEIGGHSILLIGLHSAIQKAFHRKVTVQSLFENQTLAEMAAVLERPDQKRRPRLAIRKTVI